VVAYNSFIENEYHGLNSQQALVETLGAFFFSFITPQPNQKASAAHSSRTLLRGGYLIPKQKEPRQSKIIFLPQK